MKMPTIARWKQIAVETRGAEVAEFAAVLPIVMLLILAIISFARAYNIYTTIAYAAEEGARTAVASSCATCGNQPNTATDVENRVKQVLQASKIDPSAIQADPGAAAGTSCGGGPAACTSTGSGIQVCTNVEIDATAGRRRRRGPPPPPRVTGPQACGATVSFQYPFQFNLPFTSISRQVVNLTADVQMPGEN
jgi:Flp pilus assembly protein TadG